MVEEVIKSEIRKFLDQYFRSDDLQDDDDIFEQGYVNSLFAMQLVIFVEETYQTQIENEDLILENFNTVNALKNLILRKVAEAA